jgi:hypothetical protein
MCGPAHFSYDVWTDLPILSVADHAHPATTIEHRRGVRMRRRELLLLLATGKIGARAVCAAEGHAGDWLLDVGVPSPFARLWPHSARP